MIELTMDDKRYRRKFAKTATRKRSVWQMYRELPNGIVWHDVKNTFVLQQLDDLAAGMTEETDDGSRENR